MSSEKIDFQLRVFLKYGVIPVFEGELLVTSDFSCDEDETYNEWCQRVIGKPSREVQVLRLNSPRGNTKIRTLGAPRHLIDDLLVAHKRLFDDQTQFIQLLKVGEPESLGLHSIPTEHSQWDEFHEEYGLAARQLLILDELERYIDFIDCISWPEEFLSLDDSLNDLLMSVRDAQNLDSLPKASAQDSVPPGRRRAEKEHAELILTYVDDLFAAHSCAEDDFEEGLDELEGPQIEDIRKAGQEVFYNIKKMIDLLLEG